MIAYATARRLKRSNSCNPGTVLGLLGTFSLSMGRILRQIACAAGVMSLVPTSRHLPQQRRAPSRSALQMASQLETLEPQLKRVVITGMGRVQCMNQSSRRVRLC